MLIEPLLQKLAEELEFPSIPQKDKLGAYPIDISPELQIQLKEIEAGCYLYALIGALPVLKKEELFIYLMKANFLGQGTGGGAIALDEDEKSLTLSLVIPYDMNYKTFKDVLEDFANHVEYWRGALIQHKNAAEEGGIL